MLVEAALLAVLSVEHGPGADACVTQAELVRSVERRLRRRVFVSEAEAGLRVRVSFVRQEQQLEARIELRSRDGSLRGTRTLVTSGHCSKLDDSLALSVALLVDEPPEPEEALAPSNAVAPARPSGPPRARRVIQIPPEVAAPRQPWRLAVGVAAKGTWGVLPGIRPGAVLALRLIPPTFPAIQLQGEGHAVATAERDENSGARFRLLRAGLAVCPELMGRGAFSAALCVGQQLGWLKVEGYGFDHDAHEGRLSYSLTLGGEGRLRLFGPVSFRGFVGAELPLLRDRFASAGENAQELFRPTPLGISGEIGLEASLW